MIISLCLSALLSTSIAPVFFHKKERALVTINQVVMLSLIAIVITYSFYQNQALFYSWNFLDFNHVRLIMMIQFDMLTKIMMVFIFVIGFFIYHYATTYLESDKTRIRFLSQFNLVLLSVLLLVMAANLLTAFVAWQLIGINLYLLLNHYHNDPAANRAAKKKFVINRIGDCCFLLAIVLAYHTSGTTLFSALKTSPDAELICGLLFISVMTKCAQFPFHIWLMDTMETPTPVSALMHAGVINAGGILLTRVSDSLTSFHRLTYLILCVGIVSAIFSIHWMNQQPDTKKKLAYSTMGQMGYMLIQCSLGAFPAAIFHLISHGFYKASLFLNAGETFADKQKNHYPSSYSSILQSLCIATVIFLAGLVLFKNEGLHIPLLMYGLSFLTLVTLTLKLNDLRLSLLNSVIIHLVISALFFIYLYCFFLFSRLLPQYEYAEIISAPVQIVLLAFLFCLQIALWTKREPIPSTTFKDKTEFYLRHFLLNPLRAVGDTINLHQDHKTRLFIYIGIMFAVVNGFVFGLLNNRMISNHAGVSHWCILVSLSIGIIALIAANRSLSIKSLIAYLILFELAFTNLAWFDSNSLLLKIGVFHILNISTVLLMLYLLAGKNISKDNNARHETHWLPARVFYLTVSLLLLIGIPGTASFISEFYLLGSLVDSNQFFVLLYMCLIILVAIVVMHSLQLYVFNKDIGESFSHPISKKHHGIFFFVILLNITCGLFPKLLLNHL